MSRQPPLLARALHGARAVLLALVGCLLPWAAQAQHFSFRQYTQPDGLTNLAASYLLPSRDGDMWIGTDSGLFRFDGAGFIAYDRSHGLLKEAVRGLAEDAEGRLWVWLDRGLYRGSRTQFEPVATDQGPVTPDPGVPPVFLGPDRVLLTIRRELVDLRRADPRSPWTTRPLFTPAVLRHRPMLGDVRAVAPAPDGSVWLGCGRGLCSLSTRGVRVFGVDEGVPEGDWTTLMADREGRLWARSASRLVVLDAGGDRFAPRDPPNGELKSGLTNPLLAMDDEGRVLTRTVSGLARWSGREWTEFTPANGLPSTAVSAVRVDADGDLWLSVFGQGLWHWLGYGHLESWGRSEGLSSDSVWAITRDGEGRLVFGSDHGCEWLAEADRRVHPCPYRGLPNLQALELVRDPVGDLWFGFGEGAIWTVPRDGNEARAVGSVGLRGTVAQIAFDDPGRIWIGGNANGLHTLDRATDLLSPVPLYGHAGRVWESVALPGGERCVATSSGLYRVSEGRGERVQLTHDGAAAGFVAIARQDDGTIWATSLSQGILRLPGCEAAGARWIDADVVTKAHAYLVRIDRRGWVWAGTDQGVVVFDGHVWQRLDLSDGLVWNDTNENAFYADVDGSVWIGTSAGMTHVLDPEGLFERRRKPLDLRIASASLGEHALRADAAAQRLPWEADASFDLRLASHSHGRSAHTRFEYRLLGLSPKWLGSRLPEVHLPALEPGRYRFEARADDPDHAQHSPVIAMEFEVLPPWWRSTLFQALVALAALALLALAWRAQVGRLHARRLAMEAQYREREALLHRATRDGLTGLWNRSTILEILVREIAQAERSGEPLAIALLDVDHFKRINDSLGHLAGDDVLRELGTRVDQALRQSDWIGRYGGEELLVVMPGLQRDGMPPPVERLRECVAEQPFDAQGRPVDVTLSVGLAWSRPGFDRVDDLIARADAALYEAKRAGRNRVVRAPDPPPGEPRVST